VAIVAVVCVAAVAWRLLPPPRYTAFALLQIASRPPQVAFTILETQSETKDELDTYQKTQLQLIKSRFVLNAALSDPQVVGLTTVAEQGDGALDWLSKEVNVEFLNGSDLLRIALRGERPRDLAVIVNAIMSAYLREVVTQEDARRRKRLEQLNDLYDSYQADLRTKREAFRGLAEAAGSNDQKTLAYKQRLEIEEQAAAEKELQQCRLQLRQARAELEVAEHTAGREPEPPQTDQNARLDQFLAQDTHYHELENALARIDGRLAIARRTSRSTFEPAIRRIVRERELTSASIDKYREQVASQLAAQDHGEVGVDKLSDLRDRVAVLSRLEKMAIEDLKRFTDHATASNKTTLDLQSRQDEISHIEGAAQKLGNDIEALKVELKAEQRVTERERADIPRTKEDKRPMMVCLAAMGTFALVMLGFSWVQFHERRIHSEHQVVTSLGMELVGALPNLPDDVRRFATSPVRVDNEPLALPGAHGKRGIQLHNLLVESIDAARTMILHASADLACPVLMVTSALRGEGKTSLSCHLAMSLARAQRRTLVIDCDLRKPSIHDVFDQPLEKGLSDLLRGDATVDEIIRPLPVPGLFTISAGLVDSSALLGLVRNDLGAIIDRLTEQFDFIIVDAPPVLPVTDALLIGKHVDAVLFSVLRDVSRLPKVQTAYDRLASLGIRTLGAVVAGARMDTSGYGDYLRMSLFAGEQGAA
jgi:capsular exopolysaccharide synthesis family protein